MHKGISFYFGYAEAPELRAKSISQAGFDSIITSSDDRFNFQNGELESQMELFKKYNLRPSSLHSKYCAKGLPEFFKAGRVGDEMERSYINDLYLAKKYGFRAVVYHMFGQANELGFDRIRRMLAVAEELGVFVAIENINDQKTFVEIFKHIDHKMLKFCYDSGHNNCFDRDFDYLSKYGDKLVCLHLHDNMGSRDEHTLKRFGNTNWDKLAKKLAALDPDISLDYELLLHTKNDLSAEQVLQEAYNEAKYLEEKIAFYRKTDAKLQ